MLKSLLFYIFFNIFIFNEARVFYPFYKDHDLTTCIYIQAEGGTRI